MRSHLLVGKVRHRRTRPFVYALEHDVFYLALDLAELGTLGRRFRLLGRNRWRPLTFRDDDHWLPPAADLDTSVRDHLRAEGFADADGWQITLIAYPRVLGHVFNPASFFLCRDAAGELRVVVVEVHNTHRERRLYTLRPDATRAAHVASMDKDHYVSPFISMDARYTVRVQDRERDVRIVIDETEGGQPLLQASVALVRQPLTDRAMLWTLVRFPLVTLRTIALIHWHALHLWRKGATFHSHGAATAEPRGTGGRPLVAVSSASPEPESASR
jgi:DUF1365 family protein